MLGNPRAKHFIKRCEILPHISASMQSIFLVFLYKYHQDIFFQVVIGLPHDISSVSVNSLFAHFWYFYISITKIFFFQFVIGLPHGISSVSVNSLFAHIARQDQYDINIRNDVKRASQ